MSNSVGIRPSPDRGLLFVVSSPSGAGKTTLCRRLIKEFSRLCFSVSFTTRSKRPGEVEGVDYRFVNDLDFDRMVEMGEFAEWAEVHGNRYGTANQTIHDNIAADRDVLFDIDWQGATALRSKYPEDTVMVFVLPPSMRELSRRLRRRGTDSEDVVKRRLAKATEELGHFGEYQYLVINDDLEAAYQELRAIYVSEHCAQKRRSHFALGLKQAGFPDAP